MDDLIRRQAAIHAIDRVDWYHQNKNKDMVSGASSEEEAWYKAEDIYKALDEVPAVEERPRGRWEKSDDIHGHRCSSCHRPIGFVKYDEHYAIRFFSPYCPWCGAELDDEEEEQCEL